MAERYGGHLDHVGNPAAPPGSGLGLDGVDVREAIPEIFHGMEDAGIRIAGLASVRVVGDWIELSVPLDHGVPCAADGPADGGLWIRVTRAPTDRGEIRWYAVMDVGDLGNRMYVDHATSSWSKDQIDAALNGRPDVPESYNHPEVRDALRDAQPKSLRDAVTIAAGRLGITDGAVDPAVDVTAQHRARQESAAAARGAAAQAVSAPAPTPTPAPEQRDAAPAPPTAAPEPVPLDTGHYDDGHSFGWPGALRPLAPPPLTADASFLDDLVAEAEARLADPPTTFPSPKDITQMSWSEQRPLQPEEHFLHPIAREIWLGQLTGYAALRAIDKLYADVEAWEIGATFLLTFNDDDNTHRLEVLAELRELREWVVAHLGWTAPPPSPAAPDLFARVSADDAVDSPPSGPDPDTGHYDDGHSLGREQPTPAASWTDLTGSATASDTPPEVDEPEPVAAGRTGTRRALVVGGVLAVLLVLVVAVVAMRGGGGDRADRGDAGRARGGESASAAGDGSGSASPATVVVPYGSATLTTSEYDPPRASSVVETPPTLQVECSRSDCTLIVRGSRIPGQDGVFSTTIAEPRSSSNPECPADWRYSVTYDVRSSGTLERQGIRVPAQLSGTVTRSIPRVDVPLPNGSTICFGQTTVFTIDASPTA